MTASPPQEWQIDIVRSALGLEEPPNVDVLHHLPHLPRNYLWNDLLSLRTPHLRPLFNIVFVSSLETIFARFQITNIISPLRFLRVLRSAFMACPLFNGLVLLYSGTTTLYTASSIISSRSHWVLSNIWYRLSLHSRNRGRYLVNW